MRADPAAVAFINAHICKPWADGAMGPDSFNCWGLLRAARAALFNHYLPVVDVSAFQMKAVISTFKDSPERERWDINKRALHGSAVTMRNSDNSAHIGIFLDVDRGGVLHSVQGSGVRFDHLIVLPLMGFRRITFWQPRGAA